MEPPTFFKLTSKGVLKEIPSNSKILHHQRVVLIVEPGLKRISVASGKNVKPKMKKVLHEKLKTLIKEKFISYRINQLKTQTQREYIQNLENKKSKHEDSIISNRTIPKTPVVKPTARKQHKLLGDLETQGPQIEKFQIAYFPELMEKSVDSLDVGLSILREVQLYFKGAMDAKELRNKVNDIIDYITERDK